MLGAVDNLDRLHPLHGETLSHAAARHGHTDFLQELFLQGANLNAVDLEGRTPLYYAVMTDRTEVVRYLLSLGTIDVNYQDARGRTILWHAATNDKRQTVEVLIKEFGASIDVVSGEDQTALNAAIFLGVKSMPQLFIDLADVDLDEIQADGYYPMYWAVRGGHLETVDLLLTLTNRSEDLSNLNVAAKFRRHEIMRLFIKIYKKNNSLRKRTSEALKTSIALGDLTGVRIMLEEGRAEITNETVVIAAFLDHDQILKYLLKRGAEIPREVNDGANRTTPFAAVVVLMGQAGALQVLLDHDPDIISQNMPDIPGNGLLGIASLLGYTEIVMLLVERYNVSVVGSGGNSSSPLIMAVKGVQQLKHVFNIKG